ncbi:MAG: molybdenum cofactor cytidylyltransferase [Anaerolineae bacterium]|nr:MAG: molybdenum cofactor cytidylyltransferase [Anaerolineae bacterium]
MQLRRALRIAPGLAVAFTGAGGKTSAIRRLAQEIAQTSNSEPNSLLITTTTRFGNDQRDLANLHLIEPSKGQIAGLPDLLMEHRSVLVTGPAVEDKWISPTDDTLERLHRLASEGGTVLLIEADGAQGRSLKAPAEHEPAIPKFADLLVPMAGLDALGRSIESEAVHRPELVAAMLDTPGEAEIGPIELASVLAAEEGGLKGVPDGAEVRVLLNKADGSTKEPGRQIAQALLETRRIQSVVLSSLIEDDPVREVHGRVAGVVLAAGGSSRLGEPKQLIQWRGHPLVWHAVRAAAEGGLAPIAVVAGGAADELRQALEGEAIDIVENPAWSAGQSGSVRLGLEAVAEGTEGAVFLLADLPFVGPDLVRALIGRHRQTLAPLVATWAGGRRANPVLFDRMTYSDLLSLSGDQGGRAIFRRFEPDFVEWDDSILLDVDTPEDMERLRQLE